MGRRKAATGPVRTDEVVTFPVGEGLSCGSRPRTLVPRAAVVTAPW